MNPLTAKNSKEIIVIGSGFAGLSASCHLAKAGHKVTLLEKNKTIGGRARHFIKDGFTFDMGPSWYWMPDIFEDFYQEFGFTTSDFYQLTKLDPAFRIFYPEGDFLDIPGEIEGLRNFFEQLEKGAANKLDKFFADAKFKYELGVKSLAYRPCLSITEFIDKKLILNLHRLSLFRRFDKHVEKFFKHPRLRQLMEFPILFLGTLPHNTPSLYSFMNYGGLAGGTWYPMGGMFKIIEAFEKIAVSCGVNIQVDTPVKKIIVDSCHNKKVAGVLTNKGELKGDGVIAGADYHHVDQDLLEQPFYSSSYWDKRLMAPSSLIFYLGLNKKIPGLLHHNLFFDTSFSEHAHNLCTSPAWPGNPLFYLCCPSKSDDTVAPEGHENIFILVPIAAGLTDSEEMREKLYLQIMDRLEKKLTEGKPEIRNSVITKISYCLEDFKNDYHAFKGNAYGLANTLRQTAFGKPSIKNKNFSNLFYAGQLTVPGPGVPPSIISGKIAATELLKELPNT